MGTDIHFEAQKRVAGGWVNMTRDKWVGYDREAKKDLVNPGEFHYDGGRNYYLFAWLANVRNGYGFAGVKTFEPVKPLTDHRGLPPDVIEGRYNEDTDEFEGNDFGDHSQGWATAAEILAHPRPKVVQTGVLSLSEYRKHVETGEVPDDWCGSIDGPGIVTVDSSELGDRPDATHVTTRWVMEDGLEGFVAAVREVADKYGAENVRLVFGFDS